MQNHFFRRGCFFNNSSERRKEHLMEMVNTFWTMTLERFSKKNHQIISNFNDWVCNTKPKAFSFEPIITWIGQSTFLIQIGNVNILTDPIFHDITFWIRRLFRPGISLQDLPKIDYVLISHNHRDHMEEESLHFLKKFNPIFLLPKGSRNWFKRRCLEKVIEFSWWQDRIFFLNSKSCAEIKFSFLPACHWSCRGLLDINKSLWGSWMIEFEKFKIYFAGDSAYQGHYKKIAQIFGKIDLALMPIGPNEPRALTKKTHLSTEEACQAFLDLGAKNFIPMHWGTFNISFDPFDEPLKRLKNWWALNKEHVKDKVLYVSKFGQPLKFS